MKNLYNAEYNGLFTRIDLIQPHPEALKRDIIKKGSIEKIPKNKFIVSPGDTNRYCYFIIEGFVRLYRDHETKKQKEVTTWFLHTGDFMIQQDGFYFGEKSPEYLQATEDTVCIKLHYDDLRSLCKKHPMFTDTYIYLTQLYYYQLTQRDALKAYTAKEKYQHLLKNHPYIVQKAQSSHIASYFGISETYYSKIKNGRL
ncbi:cyclic nucleotide-binding domain-containing protein [Chitinophaga sp. SYP-B3965]|uniref:Crp/Fnr family transcriptional regulator n=1 Tax=Chitinophaga sp. SYP-B3965 TaxID=2663120 RepID=UPI001299D8B3|nr:Crp/Fnr family transcriptional regulator [Chitinophaga sp. SYP-B3965]MRG45342.1 cyclic nucleotide-binding domain-containing protein [Chitinophaga sp. SYP-B3965]